MSSLSLPPITVGNFEYAERIANVLAEAFARDALNRAAILALDSLPNEVEISTARRPEQFLPGIKNKAASGAHLVEAGDWAAVAVWVPPGVKPPPPDRERISAPLAEYLQKFSEAKKRHLAGRDYWYLNSLGRHPERKEYGAIRAIFEPYLWQAQDACLPAWVEAANEHVRDVYSHFGFKVVEEAIIGEGSMDRSGNLILGGKGVVTYGMIVEPHA